MKNKIIVLSFFLFSICIENGHSRDCKQEQRAVEKRGKEYSSSACFTWGISGKGGQMKKLCQMNNGVCESMPPQEMSYFDIARAYIIALFFSDK